MAGLVEKQLHKGAGVRRPDLGRLLAGAFAARLHIHPTDPSHVVLAKVIWQLSAMIRELTNDEQLGTMLETMYNLPRDAELNRLDLQRRLAMLARSRGSGWSQSKMNTRLSNFRRERVFPRLLQEFPPPPEAEIADLVEREAEYRMGRTEPRDQRWSEQRVGQLVSDASRGGRTVLDEILPRTTVHFAVSASGNIVTTRTAELGEVVVVFTDDERLRRYLTEVAAPDTDGSTSAVGRQLFDVLVEIGEIGLAVNPLGSGNDDGGQYWSPAELAAL